MILCNGPCPTFGTPWLQCSCLENSRDGGAWWAAVYGVTQSQTWLKRLSSSSSSRFMCRNGYFSIYHIDFPCVNTVTVHFFNNLVIKMHVAVFRLHMAQEHMLLSPLVTTEDIPCGSSGKKPACQCWRHKRCRFDSWVGRISCKRKWQPTPVVLPGKSHGQRSLPGCSHLAGYSYYWHPSIMRIKTLNK